MTQFESEHTHQSRAGVNWPGYRADMNDVTLDNSHSSAQPPASTALRCTTTTDTLRSTHPLAEESLPSTPPPTSTPASPSRMILTSSPPTSPQPPRVEQPTDPRIALLKGMFPDFDDAVILSVLESTDNDQDRAIDVLLGMSDPSYIPPAAPQSRTQPQQLSQEALDEQLARRLALEEEQVAAQRWAPRDDQPREGWGQGRQNIGYQPRQSGRGWSTGAWAGWSGQSQSQPQMQGAQGQGGQRDTMAELQQGFNRIAESGKKTFSSVVSKVKAKVQEFEQGQTWAGGASNTGPTTSAHERGGGYPQSGNQGAYSPSYPGAQGTYPQWQGQAARTATSSDAGGTVRTTYTSVPPRSSSDTRISPQASYYDPNSRGYDFDDDDVEDSLNPPPAANTHGTTTLSTQSASALISSVSPPFSPPVVSPQATVERSISPTSTGSSANIPGGLRSKRNTPPPTTSPSTTIGTPTDLAQRSSILGATTSRPSSTGPPNNVDFSKLGLLPKRPISLVRPQSPPTSASPPGGKSQAQPTVPAYLGSRDDELDYVENPFEERG